MSVPQARDTRSIATPMPAPAPARAQSKPGSLDVGETSVLGSAAELQVDVG
jgi:hypothetical protein